MTISEAAMARIRAAALPPPAVDLVPGLEGSAPPGQPPPPGGERASSDPVPCVATETSTDAPPPCIDAEAFCAGDFETIDERIEAALAPYLLPSRRKKAEARRLLAQALANEELAQAQIAAARQDFLQSDQSEAAFEPVKAAQGALERAQCAAAQARSNIEVAEGEEREARRGVTMQLIHDAAALLTAQNLAADLEGAKQKAEAGYRLLVESMAEAGRVVKLHNVVAAHLNILPRTIGTNIRELAARHPDIAGSTAGDGSARFAHDDDAMRVVRLHVGAVCVSEALPIDACQRVWPQR